MRAVLNPVSKLEWFVDNHSVELAAQVKGQLLQAVSTSYLKPFLNYNFE